MTIYDTLDSDTLVYLIHLLNKIIMNYVKFEKKLK